MAYDLMTRTRFTLDDLGGTLSWASLRDFLGNLDTGSALFRERCREDRDLAERAAWLDGSMTTLLLADLYDAVSLLRWRWECAHAEGGRRPRRPRPYPRPGAGPEVERVGSDPIPVADFDEWWDSFDREVA